MNKHPRTEVSFAPTKVFAEKYGEAESERQRVAYERPTWAKEPMKPVPNCQISHDAPVGHKSEPEVILFGMAFAAGMVTGAFVVWLFYQ